MNKIRLARLSLLSIVFVTMALISIFGVCIPVTYGQTETDKIKTFTSKDNFTFDYPSNWKLTDRQNRFTTVSATIENKLGNTNSTFIIFEHFKKMNVSDPNYDKETGDQITIDNLNTGMQNKWNTKEFESGTDKYIIDNRTAPYVIGTFEKCNIFSYCNQYAVMAILIRLDDSVIIRQYMAQWNDFDLFLNQAEKIFQSVRDVEKK
jgi:hypothetical protein